MTTPAAPTTETGRQLVDWSNQRGYDLYWHVVAIEAEARDKAMEDAFDDVLAIDRAEARSTPAEALDVERLRKALLYAGFGEQDWHSGDIDLPLADAEKVADEYARLRSPESDR